MITEDTLRNAHNLASFFRPIKINYYIYPEGEGNQATLEFGAFFDNTQSASLSVGFDQNSMNAFLSKNSVEYLVDVPNCTIEDLLKIIDFLRG